LIRRAPATRYRRRAVFQKKAIAAAFGHDGVIAAAIERERAVTAEDVQATRVVGDLGQVTGASARYRFKVQVRMARAVERKLRLRCSTFFQDGVVNVGEFVRVDAETRRSASICSSTSDSR
jgi:hypothetical protein